MQSSFWFGKRVLLTGHTGFKGGWLALWLESLGAKVIGISLPPATTPNLFVLATSKVNGMENHFCDIRNAHELTKLVRASSPEIIFHLAAQPLVRASYREPIATLSSNIMGSVHLLDSLRDLNSARVAVMVTTDKVYRNLDRPCPYREDDTLGGYDPYSASKAASEIVIASYRDAFLREQGVAVATARAGNVIGGGDWSEDRLIPDAVRASQAGQALIIRRPLSVRPWQHVLEPLHGYLTLAEKLWHQPELADAYNFGPYAHQAATVREVIELAGHSYDIGDVYYGDSTEGPHESNRLTLETAKARINLGVHPKWDLVETVSRTMSWYRDQSQGADAKDLCLADIQAYMAFEVKA